MMINLKMGHGSINSRYSWERAKEWRGRRERARKARVEGLKRSATGCYSAWPGTI